VGANKMFWPQDLLDEWTLDERIIIDGARLSILAEKRTYRIEQALFFQADVANGDDPRHLVGRVRSLADIHSMGGEYYLDSVVLEDTAYTVVPGYTGEPENVDSVTPSPPAERVGGKTNLSDSEPQSIATALSAQTGQGQEASDQELLAKFLLDNL
jgi:hypothetical protein